MPMWRRVRLADWTAKEKKWPRRLRSGAGNIGDVAVFGKEMQVTVM